MKLSYIIVTHNRREPLLRTLDLLKQNTPLDRDDWETWVVDNASTDGTADALHREYPEVHLIYRDRNEGVGARSHAFGPAQGQYFILLDDDSYPIGDTVARSIAYLDSHPLTAAVVGRVLLPDGSAEACAMPAVMLSGAVCLRKSVVEVVGGFRPEFFRKAGEYDFSFRIWQAGYRIERFEDVLYRHDKVLTGRSAAFAHRMDLRNNLILVERYLPANLRVIYRDDWSMRYSAIARHAGCAEAARKARWEARLWAWREAIRGRQTLFPAIVEEIFQLRRQAGDVAEWIAENQINRVVIADFSKNIYATYRACLEAKLRINAIADPNPAFAHLMYRDVPIQPPQIAFSQPTDGCVLSNVNPAQIELITHAIRAYYQGPLLTLWRPQYLSTQEGLSVAA